MERNNASLAMLLFQNSRAVNEGLVPMTRASREASSSGLKTYSEDEVLGKKNVTAQVCKQERNAVQLEHVLAENVHSVRP